MKVLTRRSRICLTAASTVATRYHHPFLNTGHILFGLLSVEEGVASTILRGNGINSQRVVTIFEQIIGGAGACPETESDELIPFYTAQLKQGHPKWSLEALALLAFADAEPSDGSPVGTEHLLIGLIKLKDSIATRILTELFHPGHISFLEVATRSMLSPTSVASSPLPFSGTPINLASLRDANMSLLQHIVGADATQGLASWTVTDWATAVGGKTGTLLELISKVRSNQSVNPLDIAHAVGGLVLYLDFLALRLGISLEESVRAKFNNEAEAAGWNQRL